MNETHHPLAPITYDRTRITPGIVHIGVGNFHRSHQARYLDRLMRTDSAMEWGVIGVGLLPGDAKMRDVMRAQDCRYTLLERAPDGQEVGYEIGAIVQYLYAPEQGAEVLDALTNPRIRIVSMTITEGGYNISDATRDFDFNNVDILSDASHPETPRTAIGLIVAALRRRRARGIAPFTVLSCDNVQGNGDMARTAMTSFAGMIDVDDAAWIADHVAFPNSMVDRITPATTDQDRALVLERYGVNDGWPVVCENFTQWVIEDTFPLGRPPFEEVGAKFTFNVAPFEKMKLRLLNASHQVIAHTGLLAGLTFAHEAVENESIRTLAQRFMAEEGAPGIVVPGIDLNEYQRTLLDRFGNRQIQDTLVRLATDASDRIPKFLLPTIVDNIRSGRPFALGATAVAAWALRTVQDDNPTLDRQADRLKEAANRQRLRPDGFVRDPDLFGELSNNAAFLSGFAVAYERLRTAPARRYLSALSE